MPALIIIIAVLLGSAIFRTIVNSSAPVPGDPLSVSAETPSTVAPIPNNADCPHLIARLRAERLRLDNESASLKEEYERFERWRKDQALTSSHDFVDSVNRSIAARNKSVELHNSEAKAFNDLLSSNADRCKIHL